MVGRYVLIVTGAWALMAGGASADDAVGRRTVPEELELTITLLPQDARRGDVLSNVIELPKDGQGERRASERGGERSARGLETANLARQQGRDFGKAMAAAAEARREDAGRARPDLGEPQPGRAPDTGQRPDLLPQPPSGPPPGQP